MTNKNQNNTDDRMKTDIRDKAIEIARELRDECDGSYVGAGATRTVEINGNVLTISVTAFWEKTFWFEYSAKGEGIEDRGTWHS